VRAIKIFVIALGLVLIVGFVVLGTLFVQRLGTIGKSEAPAEASPSAPSLAPEEPWRRRVDLAIGESIASVFGADGRVLVTIEAENAVSRVLVIDAETGGISGEIQIVK